MSAQAIEGWKHFIRFRMQSDGSIKAYAIGVESVPNKWELDPNRKCGSRSSVRAAARRSSPR
jgi:hypothetical protein